MKRFLMWVAVLIFIGCATITENQNDDKRDQTTIQYDESDPKNGGGGAGGGAPPIPPPSTTGD